MDSFKPVEPSKFDQSIDELSKTVKPEKKQTFYVIEKTGEMGVDSLWKRFVRLITLTKAQRYKTPESFYQEVLVVKMNDFFSNKEEILKDNLKLFFTIDKVVRLIEKQIVYVDLNKTIVYSKFKSKLVEDKFKGKLPLLDYADFKSGIASLSERHINFLLEDRRTVTKPLLTFIQNRSQEGIKEEGIGKRLPVLMFLYESSTIPNELKDQIAKNLCKSEMSNEDAFEIVNRAKCYERVFSGVGSEKNEFKALLFKSEKNSVNIFLNDSYFSQKIDQFSKLSNEDQIKQFVRLKFLKDDPSIFLKLDSSNLVEENTRIVAPFFKDLGVEIVENSRVPLIFEFLDHISLLKNEKISENLRKDPQFMSFAIGHLQAADVEKHVVGSEIKSDQTLDIKHLNEVYQDFSGFVNDIYSLNSIKLDPYQRMVLLRTFGEKHDQIDTKQLTKAVKVQKNWLLEHYQDDKWVFNPAEDCKQGDLFYTKGFDFYSISNSDIGSTFLTTWKTLSDTISWRNFQAMYEGIWNTNENDQIQMKTSVQSGQDRIKGLQELDNLPFHLSTRQGNLLYSGISVDFSPHAENEIPKKLTYTYSIAPYQPRKNLPENPNEITKEQLKLQQVHVSFDLTLCKSWEDISTMLGILERALEADLTTPKNVESFWKKMGEDKLYKEFVEKQGESFNVDEFNTSVINFAHSVSREYFRANLLATGYPTEPIPYSGSGQK